MHRNGYALTYASPELRGDHEVVRTAVETMGWTPCTVLKRHLCILRGCHKLQLGVTGSIIFRQVECCGYGLVFARSQGRLQVLSHRPSSTNRAQKSKPNRSRPHATSDTRPKDPQRARQPPWNRCKRCVVRAVQLHTTIPCGPGRLTHFPIGPLATLACFVLELVAGAERICECGKRVAQFGGWALQCADRKLQELRWSVRSASTLTHWAPGALSPEPTGRPCPGSLGSSPRRCRVGLCQPGSPTR